MKADRGWRLGKGVTWQHEKVEGWKMWKQDMKVGVVRECTERRREEVDKNIPEFHGLLLTFYHSLIRLQWFLRSPLHMYSLQHPLGPDRGSPAQPLCPPASSCTCYLAGEERAPSSTPRGPLCSAGIAGWQSHLPRLPRSSALLWRVQRRLRNEAFSFYFKNIITNPWPRMGLKTKTNSLGTTNKLWPTCTSRTLLVFAIAHREFGRKWNQYNYFPIIRISRYLPFCCPNGDGLRRVKNLLRKCRRELHIL